MNYFEALKSKINIKLLQEQVRREIVNLPPCDRVGYRGWSLLSSNGDYKDGWHSGSSMFANAEYLNSSPEFRTQMLNEIHARPGEDYVHPTQLYKGYLKKIIQFLDCLGFQPHRVQIALLKANEEISWHQDSPEGQYCVRLHIPIFTNASCFFEYPEKKIHLKADGSIYLLDGSKMHRFVNQGLEDRYHFISYVRDTQGHSQSFKFSSKNEF